jgi:hypothetical protein
MRQRSKANPDPAQPGETFEEFESDGSPRRPDGRGGGPRARPRRNWFSEPKSAVWMVLAAVVIIGGGRRLRWAMRARRAVARLAAPDVTPEQIESVAEFGRSGAWELLRIFSSTDPEPRRMAAGRALTRLWRHDELVAEEEQAILRRGYAVTWRARRRYPRALHAEIPIAVTIDVPFLIDDALYVGPDQLEWSHRILGARRAAMEEFSPWKAGPGRVDFSMIPDDFSTNGPHRLVLQSRVRPCGLSSSWEIELPHVPFNFEFDPNLRLDAILNLADAVRDESIARVIRLERVANTSMSDEPTGHLPLGGEWILRDPPRLAVATPLPCDLAHATSIEIEGIPGQFPGRPLIVSGQGVPSRDPQEAATIVRRFELGPVPPLPDGVIERPGVRRMRLRLTADPGLGWADPDVRSVWPGSTETNWVEVEIIRK